MVRTYVLSENKRHFRCSTQSELPADNLLPEDSAYTQDNGKRWRAASATTWIEAPYGFAAGTAGPHTHSPSEITGTAVVTNDARLSDARTPTTHNQDASTINAGTIDGDRLPALSQTKRGGVPATGAPSGKFLKDDGTWAAPAGGSGNGYVLNGAADNQATTTDSQTIYWGCFPGLAVTTTAGNTRIYIPKAGAIKAACVFSHAATAGTNENWSMYIRLNNSSDTLIQTLAANTNQRLWAKYDLNITVAAGDYIEIKEVQPAWATNPANVRRACAIYIE